MGYIPNLILIYTMPYVIAALSLLQVKWGQGKKGDSAKRSLAKAVLWRVFAASNTLICGVFLARDLSVASKIAGSDTIFKTVSVGAKWYTKLWV